MEGRTNRQDASLDLYAEMSSETPALNHILKLYEWVAFYDTVSLG